MCVKKKIEIETFFLGSTVLLQRLLLSTSSIIIANAITYLHKIPEK